MKVYLTLFKDGEVLPEGAVGDARSECSKDGCPEHTDERGIRLTMLCELLQGMGYEVSFTEEPDQRIQRDGQPFPQYEEVS